MRQLPDSAHEHSVWFCRVFGISGALCAISYAPEAEDKNGPWCSLEFLAAGARRHRVVRQPLCAAMAGAAGGVAGARGLFGSAPTSLLMTKKKAGPSRPGSFAAFRFFCLVELHAERLDKLVPHRALFTHVLLRLCRRRATGFGSAGGDGIPYLRHLEDLR